MITKIKENLLFSLCHDELALSYADAQELLDQIDKDQFTNLNYEEDAALWAWFSHVKNLAEIAGNRQIMANTSHKTILLHALQFFLKETHTHENSWYQQIGLPRYLGRLYFLFEKELTAPQKDSLLSYIEKGSISANPQLTQIWTGTNLLWVAMNNLMYAVIMGDASLISVGIEAVAKELTFHDNTKPGIQTDYSFIPYPTQFYIQETAYSFVEGCAALVYVLQGTDCQIPADALVPLGFYVAFGASYGIRNATYDYLTTGNNILIPNGLQAEKMRQALWMFIKTEGMACRDVMQEQLASLSYEMYCVKNSKYSYATNTYVCRTVTSHISCLGTSPLTPIVGSQLPANLYAGGATCIMVNGKEYDNIFPLWDFSHVPGTTAVVESNTQLVGGKKIQNTYCGGLSHNDIGILYQVLNSSGVTGVTARFFVDGMMIALGANLSCERNEPVTTTLNQCHKTDETQTYEQGIYQGKVAYVSLDQQSIVSVTQEKSGCWCSLNKAESKTEQGEVCTFYIDHGNQPKSASYAYAVIPAVTAADSEERIGKLLADVKVLRNDDAIQAIEYKNKIYCVFHKSGFYSVSRFNHFVSNGPAAHIFNI
ncbi:MAG: hypothetical protein IKM39_00935 [Clostridia bacterium]|nr:hypothetical protein [Clostridia bacterium]